jgi:hypothetical protein
MSKVVLLRRWLADRVACKTLTARNWPRPLLHHRLYRRINLNYIQ